MNNTFEMKSGKAASSASRSTDMGELNNALLNLFNIGMKSVSNAIQNIGTKSNTGKCGCGDAWCDCYPCGPLTSDTDLRVEGRMGERRLMSFIIENNKKEDCNVKLSVVAFFDACGNSYNPDKCIILLPDSLTIKPESCTRVRVGVNFTTPLDDGQVYYAEIKVEGACCAENISLGIWVEPDNYADFLTYCDPCKPKLGKFVDFVNCECGGSGSSDCGCGCYSRARSYYVCPDSAPAKVDSTRPNVFGSYNKK